LLINITELSMKHTLFAITIVLLILRGPNAAPQDIHQFENDDISIPISQIDVRVLVSLKEKDIQPARPCSDEVFIRRIYLDVIGALPDSRSIHKFMDDSNPDKRAALIDYLLEQEEFADYWSLKWCDLLRVKAEFPINLWPNAVQAYHHWIREAIKQNMPYDKFARALLTTSGSNFREPPVNFYRAMQGREPSAIAAAVAQMFMGTRIDQWPKDRRVGMEAFFTRIAFKKTAEWKEEIVSLDPAPTKPLDAFFPDGGKVTIQPDVDPRLVFADWLITKENQWFSLNIVNRIWAWLLGRGIIHEPDDIRPDNPGVNPRLLACLEKELIKSNFNMKHIFRLILNSRTYQQSPIPLSDHPDAEALFAHYPVRRLEAEVLIDALCWISGTTEAYSSPIPEPFTNIPEEHRTINLADGSITSQFLEMFGRPARDTGFESERNNRPTDAQRLHMLNSTHIQKKIEDSERLKKLIKATRGKPGPIINSIYINVLSRYPTDYELNAVQNYYDFNRLSVKQASIDLVWALINSKEFLYRH